MSLTEKKNEIYEQIRKINEIMNYLLANYKDFETFNKIYLEEKKLWKQYNFYEEMIKAKKVLDVQ